jgi:hypothetical protein
VGLGAQAGELAERFARVVQLVTEVVGDPAEGVDVAEVLPQVPRQQHRDD